MTVILQDIAPGWFVGDGFAKAKRKEDEVKQGKNYFFASLTHLTQLAHLSSVILKLAAQVLSQSQQKPLKILCNIIPLASLPISPLMASVKTGDYENLAKLFNHSKYAYIKLPEKLSSRTVTVVSFLVEHTGDMIRVAMIAASVATIAFGNMAFGVAVLSAIAYETLDTLGYVPYRISLLMERFSPVLNFVGVFVGGIWITRALSAVALSTYLFPSINHFFQYKLDDAIKKVKFLAELTPPPTLREIDSPLQVKENLTYSEIKEVLFSPFSNFKINPAHCSKWGLNLKKFPEDHQFGDFLKLFDTIDWPSKYQFTSLKIKDDERFFYFLKGKFPNVDKKTLNEKMDEYILKLASEKNMSKEQYVANWVHEQMVELNKILLNQKRVKGLQTDLEDAKKDLSKILAYLKSSKDQIEKEDILLKLAIEGGDYCARGIKRASNEIIRGVLQKGFQPANIDDEIKNYEVQIEQLLLQKRSSIVQSAYDQLTKGINNTISKDVHSFDLYRTLLSLGVFPLTQYEREKVGLAEIMSWNFYGLSRKKMYFHYFSSIEEVFKERGEIHFTQYINGMIGGNPFLTQEEKDKIVDLFISFNNDNWSPEETLKRFHYLMLFKIGVLRKIK